MTIRIALVDDQELVRLGFRMVLEAEPDVEVVSVIVTPAGMRSVSVVAGATDGPALASAMPPHRLA